MLVLLICYVIVTPEQSRAEEGERERPGHNVERARMRVKINKFECKWILIQLSILVLELRKLLTVILYLCNNTIMLNIYIRVGSSNHYSFICKRESIPGHDAMVKRRWTIQRTAVRITTATYLNSGRRPDAEKLM